LSHFPANLISRQKYLNSRPRPSARCAQIVMSAIPDGAACYFCLGEEADEEGMPLVRDCSCRGDSAGFAHLSCLTKYAEQKSKQAGDGDLDAFSTPWKLCNNCKQPFQNQLSIDMASACYLFAETTYGHAGNSKCDKMKVIDSLRSKIRVLSNTVDKELVKVEMTILLNKMISMVDQTKTDLKMSRWIHMPKGSEEYEYYEVLCGNYEAYAYLKLGVLLLMWDSSEEEFKTMITHYKKARAIYNLVDMKDKAEQMDTLISLCSIEKQAANNKDASSTTERNYVLQFTKSTYEQYLNTQGMNSAGTIESGLLYAKRLRDANHCIESERLVTQLATISRRVHGPDH